MLSPSPTSKYPASSDAVMCGGPKGVSASIYSPSMTPACVGSAYRLEFSSSGLYTGLWTTLSLVLSYSTFSKATTSRSRAFNLRALRRRCTTKMLSKTNTTAPSTAPTMIGISDEGDPEPELEGAAVEPPGACPSLYTETVDE